MNRLIALMLAAMGVVASASAAQFMPGEVLVKFKPGAEKSALFATRSALIKEIPGINVSHVRLPKGMTTEQGVDLFKNRPDVEYVSPNYIAHAFLVPNDPRYNQQWHLPKIQAPEAWDLYSGAPTVTIAIVDSGVDMDHEDLAAKLVPGRDFINNDDDPDDDNGHGTHCAGIAAGIANNNIGIAGLAWQCKIMPVKVLGSNGSGGFDAVAAGVVYAADNGAQVISMSLGSFAQSPVLTDAVSYALDKGSIVIAAAGNHGTTQKAYPAATPGVLAVANSMSNDQRNPGSAYGDWVHVAAPGTDIMSCFPGSTYGTATGTSMACPLVAGLAGIIKSAAPSLDVDQLKQQIFDNCDPVGDYVIYGRINAFKSYPNISVGGDYTALPSSFRIIEGGSPTGDLPALFNQDGITVNFSPVYVNRLGQTAAIEATVPLPVEQEKVLSMDVTFDVKGPRGLSVGVYMWNFEKNTYDYIKSVPFANGLTSGVIKLTSPYGKYIREGVAKPVLRVINPQTVNAQPAKFVLQVDRLVLTGKAEEDN